MTETARAAYGSVDELLADARARIQRLSPTDVRASLSCGALLVDIRPLQQRLEEAEIAGALVIERNHLEWRLHPRSAARMRSAVDGQQWVVFCSEGYTSSLAAASLESLGVPARDMIGGFRAWQAAGLPTVRGGTAPGGVSGVASGR